MIRTRNFLLFVFVFTFLLSGIGGTILTNAWDSEAEAATVLKFDQSTSVVYGAKAMEREVPRDENINRLRDKLARGGGDIDGGEPIFTSVDTVVSTNTPLVTDDVPPPAIQIGFSLNGKPLFNDNLWRFVGFSHIDQIGVALNDVPIYGSYPNPELLDSCGGIGGKYYLPANKEVNPECYK